MNSEREFKFRTCDVVAWLGDRNVGNGTNVHHLRKPQCKKWNCNLYPVAQWRSSLSRQFLGKVNQVIIVEFNIETPAVKRLEDGGRRQKMSMVINHQKQCENIIERQICLGRRKPHEGPLAVSINPGFHRVHKHVNHRLTLMVGSMPSGSVQV